MRGSVLSTSNLAAQGGDRRVMIAPVVDCAAYQSSQTAPVQQWACVLLLHPIVNNASGNSQLVAGGSSTSGGNGKGNGNGKNNGNGNSGGTSSVPQMYLEYLGNASEASSPCASVGLPGGSGSNGPLVPALVR